MKTHQPPDPEPLHVQAQSLRAWVLTAVAIVLGWVERYLPRSLLIVARQDVRAVASEVRELIVMMALTHGRWEKKRGRAPAPHPHGAAPGFRPRVSKSSPWRHFKRLVRLRGGTLAARLAGLREVLFTLKKCVARMVARFAALKPRVGLLAVAPPACAVCALSAPACMGVDTS